MSSDLLGVDDTFDESPPEQHKTATPPQPTTYDLGSSNVKTTERRDKNWQSGRQSILDKYDKNGDGIYDTAEVNAIVDDYMTTIQNNNALIETTQGQKKLLMFSGLMIFILSLSNLGTGFLAANLAKDVRVDEDGMMASTANGKAIKTMNTADSMSVKATWGSVEGGRRKLSEPTINSADPFNIDNDFDEYDLVPESEGGPQTCLTEDEVKKLYNNVKDGSGTSLTLVDEYDPSLEKTVFIGGKAERRLTPSSRRLSEENGEDIDVTNVEYVFEDSNVVFKYAPEKCNDGRRNLKSSMLEKMFYFFFDTGRRQLKRHRLTGDEDITTFDIDLDALRKSRNIVGRRTLPNLYVLQEGVCTRFYANPRDIDENERRNKFVRQFKPCGYHDKLYQDENCQQETSYQIIETNLDYPQRGPESDILDLLYLVRFDVGRHPRQPVSELKNIDVSAINFKEGESIGTPEEIMSSAVEGETCLETFAFGGDDWGWVKKGNNVNNWNSYNCQGFCGSGCMSTFTTGKDCMKHDVCSYYKSLIQEFPATGFGDDVDCGDEAGQTVIGCWEDRRWPFFDRPVICEDKEKFYAEIHPVARQLGKQPLLDRTGMDRGQGMLRPWNYLEE